MKRIGKGTLNLLAAKFKNRMAKDRGYTSNTSISWVANAYGLDMPPEKQQKLEAISEDMKNKKPGEKI